MPRSGQAGPSEAPGLSPTQDQVAAIILGEGRRLGAPRPALIASMYAALGETALGSNPRTYVNNGVGYWGVLQGDMRDWPDPHDIRGQAQAFFTGRGPQGQTDFHVGAINWVRQGVTYPPEIAVRTEVPSIWPADAYAPGFSGGQQGGINEATSIVDHVTGTAGPAPPTPSLPTQGENVPQIIVSGDLYDLLTQLDYAGMDINLWKELRDSADAVSSSAAAYLSRVQKTTVVKPHKAG